MYAVTSNPLISRTRATLRSAEFGFFGVVVYTRVHTPRRCGHPFSAGVLLLLILALRPLRTSCWMVGTGSASPFGRNGRAVLATSFELCRRSVAHVCWWPGSHRPPRSGVSPGRRARSRGRIADHWRAQVPHRAPKPP